MISRIPFTEIIHTMPRRKKMGERLREARIAQGISLEKLQKRIEDEQGVSISPSTIRESERDKFPNPGFKTIEYIARGLGLDPLDIMASGLDSPPPETDLSEAAEKFSLMKRLYERLTPPRKPWFDELIEMVTNKLREG